jgi:hypothetical protein
MSIETQKFRTVADRLGNGLPTLRLSRKVCILGSGVGGILATLQWRFVRCYQSGNQREQITEFNSSEFTDILFIYHHSFCSMNEYYEYKEDRKIKTLRG